MNKDYMCYCGLYCENRPVNSRVAPAARVLYEEMRKAGFEDVINTIPGGDGFWSFLKGMAEGGSWSSCKEGCGNPGCAVRLCAKEKGVELCAFCDEYPCEKFNALQGCQAMKQDSDLLRSQGIEAWAKLQDERRKIGFTYF